MKTVFVPTQAKALNSLLNKARHRNVVIESADGERFVLASIKQWQGFDVGDSDDFAEETKRTAQNKKLAKAMADRREKDKGKPRLSAAQVRKEIGLKQG
jgi:PHD/YefM family antitoxin component YafN of YafNO toxin-antitoxin module